MCILCAEVSFLGAPCLFESLLPQCLSLGQQTFFLHSGISFSRPKNQCPWSTVSLLKLTITFQATGLWSFSSGHLYVSGTVPHQDSPVFVDTGLEGVNCLEQYHRVQETPAGKLLLLSAAPLILKTYFQPCRKEFLMLVYCSHRNWGWKLKKKIGLIWRLKYSSGRSSRWVTRTFWSSHVFVFHLENTKDRKKNF